MEKTCTSEFFKNDRICNLKSLKIRECMFFQIARETIPLLVNNINEKILQ